MQPLRAEIATWEGRALTRFMCGARVGQAGTSVGGASPSVAAAVPAPRAIEFTVYRLPHKFLRDHSQCFGHEPGRRQSYHNIISL
jgi:hypothetical protein